MGQVKNFILGILLVGALVAIVVSWAKNKDVLLEGEVRKPGQQNVCLVYKEGEIQLKTNGKWQQIKPKKKFTPGSILKTLNDSRAELEFVDKGVLRLDENTEIELVSLEEKKIAIKQNSGQTFHRGDYPGDYLVEVRGVKLKAQGTSFLVRVSEEERLKILVQVCGGKIKIAGQITGKALPEREIKAGYQVLVDSGKVGIELVEVAKIDPNQLKTAWHRFCRQREIKAGVDPGILRDANLPYLEILEPRSGATVYQSQVRLRGKVTPEARVFVGEQEIENQNGNFTTVLNLTEGINYFEILAWFEEDQKVTRKLAIKYQTEETEEAVPLTSISLSAEAKADGVHLSWSKYGGPDFGFYKIIRQQEEIGEECDDSGLIQAFSDVNRLETVDKTTQQGQQYFYRIFVVKKYSPNEVLALSNLVRVIAQNSNSPPQPVQLQGKMTGNGVQLSWTASSEEDFWFYKVVRSTVNPQPRYPDDGYIAVKGKQETAYLDTEIKPDTPGTFYYSVCVIDRAGQIACSNPLTVSEGKIK